MKMRLSAKITVLAAALLSLSFQLMRAQEGESFLRNLQGRDTALVGDRLRYGASLGAVEEGTSFALPDLQAASNDSVTVLSPWKMDTLRLRKARKGRPAEMDLEISLDLTCFEEGTLALPAIPLLRRLPSGETDTLLFEGRSVDVRLMPVDTAGYVPHDLRGQVKYPLTFRETLPYAAGILLLALAVVLICLLVRRRKARREGLGTVESPHIVALRKLEAYRGGKLWAPEKQKQFYSGVTDVLREYMAARYGFGAQEMTTAEIFALLSKTDLQKALYDEMKLLFETSDFVKFAKLTVSDEENAKVLPQAIRFVTETYQEVLDKEAAQAAAGEKEA